MKSTGHVLQAILFIMALFCPIAKADNSGHISGKVQSISGLPLGDAVITIIREEKKRETISFTRSDSRGIYKLTNLIPGTYYLQAALQGYQPAATSNVRIDPGRTTSLDIVLEEFFNYISNDDDPRNQDLKSVMRGSSDRRFIFRDLPGNSLPESVEDGPSFNRSGAMNFASTAGLPGSNYPVFPKTTPTGVASNFAFTQPVSKHSRMIFSGRLDYGYGSYWRIRNTYNYRPDKFHDYKISAGYGRINPISPEEDYLTNEFFSGSNVLNESVMQSIAFGLEGTSKFLDILEVQYGFDYSRLTYSEDKSYLNPSIQVLISPFKDLFFKASFTSRRVNDTDSVVLPDGEMLNLSEPVLITIAGNQINMSRFNHSEISAQKFLTPGTSVEIALYEDNMQGPGLPFLLTTNKSVEHRDYVAQLSDSNSKQHGMRITMNRRLFNYLSSSIAYVYGSATNVGSSNIPQPSEYLATNLLSYLQQSYYHAITGQVDTNIPQTGTNLLATVRWHPRNPITPIDWFSDHMDIGSKSVNLEIRQIIPVPSFMGANGRWEAMVDLRNLFNQGREVILTSDGDIVISRNPRSMRFGLSLSFH